MAVLVAVVAVSGFLRFQGITEKGIFSIDAANYLREGRLIAGVARASAGGAARWIEERLTGKDLFRWEVERERIAEAAAKGSALGYAKPTHTLLVSLSLLLLGDDPSAGNLMSAAFGTGSVVLVFAVARAFYASSAAGLAAAVILGLSPYHVIYSREGIPDAQNGLFFLLATYCYWRSTVTGHLSWLAAAGLLAGLVYTGNDRWIIIPLLLVVPEVLAALSAPQRRANLAARLGILLSAMAVPLLLWEALFYVLLLSARLYGNTLFSLGSPPAEGLMAYLTQPAPAPFLTYIEQLFLRFIMMSAPGFDVDPGAYPTYLWTLQGWPILALLVLAALLALARLRTRGAGAEPLSPGLLLWPQIILVAAFFSSIHFHHPRLFTLTLPAVALLAAGAWYRWLMAARLPRSGLASHLVRASPWLYAIALALNSVALSLPALEMRTGLPKALAYVRERGGFLHLAVNHPMSRVYIGEHSAFPADSNLTRTKAAGLLDEGYNYLVVSLYELMGRNLDQLSEPSTTFFAQVFANCEPAYVTPDRGELYFYQFAYDGLPNPAHAALLLASLTPHDRQTANRVYDLGTCLRRLGAHDG